jgi:hypothetical protein
MTRLCGLLLARYGLCRAVTLTDCVPAVVGVAIGRGVI